MLSKIYNQFKYYQLLKFLLKHMTKQKAICKICGATLTISENVEVSEIITCSECHTRLVVQNIRENEITLNEAPKVEEDWGE